MFGVCHMYRGRNLRVVSMSPQILCYEVVQKGAVEIKRTN